LGSEAAPPKKSETNGSDSKEKDAKKPIAKGKSDVATIASVVAESSAQQTQPQHIEKAKDLKVEVPVVSAAGPSLNEDAHHINNVRKKTF
jgi:hypothetical protein